MKILVLSDSHGVHRYLQRAVRREQPDAVLHLGDHTRDAQWLCEQYPDLPVAGVPGNCDYAPLDNPIRIKEYGGARVFMTHGHVFGVKASLLRLELAAREAMAQVALFGHTHQPYCEEKDGLWLLNPGACMGPGRASCGVILVENGKILCYTKADLAELTEGEHAFND